MDLQARPPAPTPVFGDESLRETRTQRAKLSSSSYLPLTPTPTPRPFQNLNEHFWKSPERPGEALAVPRCCGVILSVFISRAPGDVVVPHRAVSSGGFTVGWCCRAKRSGLPRDTGRHAEAHNFCYSKPERAMLKITPFLSL